MAKKRTPGQRMIVSARQALAFAQGEDNACVVHIADEIDTARIRKKIKMTQSQFAAYFGVSVRTVQEWEQDCIYRGRFKHRMFTARQR